LDDGPDAARILEEFERNNDLPNFSVYYCPNPLRHGARKRSLENVEAITHIWADIDLKDLEEASPAVETKLQQVQPEPTRVNLSGGGYHPINELHEPIPAEDTEMFERACRALKGYAASLSGDPAPTAPHSLLRVLGTHNSKRDGDPVEVRTLWGSGRTVDLTDIEGWIDSMAGREMFTRKPKGNGSSSTQHKPLEPGEWKPKVNVDQRLAEVQHHGPGDSGVHATELSVTASLLCSGYSVDAAVLTVMEDMAKSLGPEAASWDWDKEAHRLKKQCTDWICKRPDLSGALPDRLREDFESILAEGRKPGIIYGNGRGWYVRRVREA
jgi:hypothetical protein